MAEPQPEFTRPLIDVPQRVIRLLDRYQSPPDDKIISRDEVAEHSNIYSGKDILPEVGQVRFDIEFRHYFEKWEKDFDMITFRYDNDDGLVGEMQFLLLPDGRYGLSHRYVAERNRGKGVGERLLKQAEHILQSLADYRCQPVHIMLRLGQRQVLRWFLKQGYAPEASQADIVQAVLEHPEQFVLADIEDKPGDDPIKRQEGIFLPTTEGRKIEDTVRINLEKVFSPEL